MGVCLILESFYHWISFMWLRPPQLTCPNPIGWSFYEPLLSTITYHHSFSLNEHGTFGTEQNYMYCCIITETKTQLNSDIERTKEGENLGALLGGFATLLL
jgi:hypothetical protein